MRDVTDQRMALLDQDQGQVEQRDEHADRLIWAASATHGLIDEAERLAGIFGPKQLTIHVVEGAGHASTCGARVDLAALFRQTFPRLRRQNQKKKKEKQGNRWVPWRKAATEEPDNTPRTSMKPIAAKGEGKYLGMEPRYDNSTIGLSPLEYWSPAYYQKLSTKSNSTDATGPTRAR